MGNTSKFYVYYIILMTLLFLSNCSAINTFILKKKPVITVTIVASDSLNIDQYGKSHSVKVRLYQLKDVEKFKEIEFHPLWTTPEGYLGDELIEVSKNFIALPERKYVKKIEKQTDAAYIGIAAGYIAPKSKTIAWQALKNKKHFVIGLFKNHLTMKPYK